MRAVTVTRATTIKQNVGAETKHLGKLLVNADDLEALVGLLRAQTDKASRIRVEFVGGVFTSAADLKKLSDFEMQSLRVVAAHAQVILNLNMALAVGINRDIEDVYESWARTRQTRKSPSALQGGAHRVILLISMLAMNQRHKFRIVCGSGRVSRYARYSF